MADKLGIMISQLWFRVQLFIENAERIKGADQLNERDLVLLDYLERRQEVSFSELSAFFKKTSPSTMSNTLKRLYQKKLVTRREDPKDLRAKCFSVTAKGRRVLEPIRRGRAELSQIIADSLRLKPEETALIAQAIVRANQTFDHWMGLSGKIETAGSDDHGTVR